MRLIYEHGKKIEPDPKGFYVYLWMHNEVARYVGKGVNSRWASHSKPRRNDSNQPKYRYFLKHVAEMTCFVIAEGLTEAEAANLEIAEIDLRGLEVNGTGTLLNDRRGSVVYGPRGKRDLKDTTIPYQRWIERKRQPIPLNAMLRRAGPTLTGNPKKPGSPGAAYIDLFYPPLGKTVTIAELLAKGRHAGLTDRQQLDHITWDHSHGFIELTLPD
jgi:hypothetical protein